MGAYSELDMERRYGGGSYDDESERPAFTDEDDFPAFGEEPALQAKDTAPVQGDGTAALKPEPAQKDGDDKKAADEAAKRKAHEEAEAKRKAEFDARQAAKKAAEREQLDRLEAMSDDEALAASMKRVSADTEKLTRRNMKECVAEHIQTMCIEDPAFARKVMHPRKSMVHCFWYINRKAREFVGQEMKDNDAKPENGVYGSDVPDDLCYQWAVDYFNDPDAEEDHKDDEKFVPKPYYGGGASKSKGKPKDKAKKEQPKKDTPKPAPKDSANEQMSLLGVA